MPPDEPCGATMDGVPAEEPALDVLLSRLAGELDGLARIAAALDADIGRLAARPDPAALRRRMQDLDLLRQMASDLAIVQRHVAELMPVGLALPVDAALARLQLGDVAARLRGVGAQSATTAAAGDGTVDLF